MKPTTSTDLRRHHALVFKSLGAEKSRYWVYYYFFSLHPSTTSERWRKTSSSALTPGPFTQTNRNVPLQLSRVAAVSRRVIPPGHFIRLFYSIKQLKQISLYFLSTGLAPRISQLTRSTAFLICSTSSLAQSRFGLLFLNKKKKKTKKKRGLKRSGVVPTGNEETSVQCCDILNYAAKYCVLKCQTFKGANLLAFFLWKRKKKKKKKVF